MSSISEADLAEILSNNSALRISPENRPQSGRRAQVAESPPIPSLSPQASKAAQGNARKLALAISEADLQSSVIDLAHLYRWKVAHFRSVKVTRKDGSTYWQTPVQADGEGWPDLVCCRADPAGGLGRVIFAELKREKEKPKPKQTEWLSLLTLTKRVEVYCWRPSDLLAGTIDQILR